MQAVFTFFPYSPNLESVYIKKVFLGEENLRNFSSEKKKIILCAMNHSEYFQWSKIKSHSRLREWLYGTLTFKKTFQIWNF